MEQKKRSHSDVDPGSSPELFTRTETKRPNIDNMADTETRSALENIQAQLNELLTMKPTIESVKSTVADLKSQLTSVLEQIKSLEGKCRSLTQTVEVCKQENSLLKHKLQLVEEKQIKAEAYSRRDNLKFDGIPESTGEDLVAKVKDIIRVNMKCPEVDNMNFVRVHRLPGLQKPRQVIVKFQFYPDREKVWSRRRLLKSSNIWVSEDFPKEIENRRQVLTPILKAAWKQPNIKASLAVDKLYINNQMYTVDTLHQLPPQLSLQQTSLVSTADKVFFFGRSSPLSNFFPASFNIDGRDWKCTEQYYQARKAEVHQDAAAYESIMLASDPLDMYKIGSRINTSPRWKQGIAREVMEKANLAKYSQNDHLKAVLRSTEGKMLVEASPTDLYWGIGVSVRHAVNTPTSQWTGENHMGKVLEKVRTVLKD